MATTTSTASETKYDSRIDDSNISTVPMAEKREEGGSEEEIETVTPGITSHRTISRVPGNFNYFEKDGLRTEGDGVDHFHYNPGSIGFIMSVLGCAFALAGSQICPLLFLTLGTTIAAIFDAVDIVIWMFTALIVAMGALAPFVGPLADMFGRKTIFLVGLGLSVLGSILCAAAPNAASFIAGQVFLGFGAITQELLAIAIVGEIVPTAKRPLYGAMILCAIIPWTPGTLYANWMAEKSWRWIGCVLAIWNVITMAIIAVWYNPPPRVNSLGLTRREMFQRIDFIGGLILTTGLILFLVALNSGGQTQPWSSAYVLCFLIIGIVTIVSFGFWEAFGAKWPLFPKRIIQAPRPFFCLLFVIFAAGINYIPLVVFWPIQSISVYGAGHIQNGINTLLIGFCILGGAIVSAILIGLFPKHITFTMTLFCVMQTVGSACLVAVDPHNIKTVWAPLVFALVGVGGVLVPNQVIITVITPDDLIASVTALTVGLRSQAQVVGIAVFYNRLVTEITQRAVLSIALPMFKAGIVSVPEITAFVHNLTATPFYLLAPEFPSLKDPTSTNYIAVQQGIIECFGQSFRSVYFITIAFGVSACLAASCMGDVSKYMDRHIAVVL